MPRLRRKALVKSNLDLWLNDLFLKDGFFIDVSTGETDVYGRDISEMRNKILVHKINTVVAVNDPKYSPEVVERIEKAYYSYKEDNPDAMPCERGGIPLGSSDACMYSKAGYKASFIIIIDGKVKKPAHWHSVTDIYSNIDKKVLKNVIGIGIKFVELVDKEFES